MIALAKVKRIFRDQTVEVEVQRVSACGGDCSKCGGCSELKTGPVTALAMSKIPVEVGDRVAVEGEFKQVMSIAFVVYIIPLLLFFLFFGVSALLGMGEGISSLCGGLGFIAGVFLALWYNHYLTRKNCLSFTIIQKIENQNFL